MNATKRSKSINLCVYIFLFITNILAEQDSISIQIPIDSISHNKEELSADIIDSIDTLFIDKINSNQSPQIINPIPPILMYEDEKLIVNLTSFYSYVSDPDDSIDSIQWIFSDGNNTSTSLINDQLYLQPAANWYGVDSIKFIISDSLLSDTSVIPIHVNPQNDPPKFFSRLDTIIINEDDTIILNVDKLDSIIHDIDNNLNELSWSIIENYPFKPIVDNRQILIKVVDNWYGNGIVKIIASDNESSDTLDVNIYIYPVNDPPSFIKKIPSANINEDEMVQIAFIDWIEFISDVDNSDESLIWNAQESSNIELTLYENSLILKSKPNWYGVDTIMLSITDEQYSDSIEWVINVNPVNDSPKFLKNIFTYDFYEDNSLKINKKNIISEIYDPDNNIDQLALKISLLNNINISEDDHNFIISAGENWFGKDSLILSVDDGELTDDAILLIEILPVNDPPEFLTAIPDTSMYEDGLISFKILQWITHISDPDNDVQSLEWKVISPDYIDIKFENETVNIKSLNNWYGNETIDIIASDQELSDTTEMIISVLPVNDFPAISYIPPITINEDEHIILQLDQFVHDRDDHDSVLTWSAIKSYEKNNYNSLYTSLYKNSRRYLSTFLNQDYLLQNKYGLTNEDVINWVKIDSKNQIAHVQPPANYFGKDIPILLQVEDPMNAKDIELLSITIEPINDAPVINNIPTLFIQEDELFQDSINIWNDYVVDIDNLFQTLDWELINFNKWVKYDLINNKIIIEPQNDWFGNDTIIIIVSDGELSDSSKAIINVASVNDPPEPFELIDNVIEDSTKFTFQWYPTFDVDNDTVEYHFHLKGSNIDTVIYGIIDKYSVTLSMKNKLNTGTPYLWYVSATDRIDTVLCEEKFTFYVKTIPKSFAIHQNYPNPFNKNTKIPIDMLHGDALRIVIYDMHGKQIKTLSDEFKSAGKYELEWDGTDRFGKQVSTGVYLTIMQTRNFSQARKIMYIK